MATTRKTPAAKSPVRKATTDRERASDASSLTVPLRNLAAEKVGEVTLPEEIFGVPFRRHLVWEVVKQIRAREHRGTHKTKVRSEVSGSGKKPFKQKHTGRARQGGGRPPIHRHGGTSFGPTPHSYDLKVNVNAKKAALPGVLARLGVEGKALVLDRKENVNLSRAAANNPKVQAMDVLGINVYDALNASTLVFSEDALRTAIEVLA